MSIDRCGYCNKSVDTDYDDGFYEVMVDSDKHGGTRGLCKKCREELKQENFCCPYHR